jgi:periplasmic copper chaperone A
MKHTKIAAAAAAAPLLLLAAAGAASAHVTVTPTTATPGAYATFSFKVPTESDTASTTKLDVQFPTATPLASVSVQPHVGWSFQVKTTKLATPITTDDGQVTEAVSEIVWTADSAATAIKPGEFDMFTVSAGPLPDSGTLEFKALQTYSDGSIVRWIEDPAPAGQPEPDHPAPLLTIAAASSGTTGTADTAAPSSTTVETKSSKGPWILSIIALVVAVAGAGGSFLRRKA